MLKVGVVGATGYTGEEIVTALSRHPEVEITALTGLVEKEELFSKLYPRFGKRVSLTCKNLNVDEVASASELVFLALPHTVSMKVAPELLKKGRKVIDLSADYRLSADLYEKWYGTKHADTGNLAAAVYGLPELFRDKIKKAALVANPGCYPTSVILALLPLAKVLAGKGIEPVVDSKSGVTGAGRKGHVTLSFGEVDENLKCYKANAHQHMPEMGLILGQAAGGSIKVNFTPHLIPIRRGIMSTIYMPAKDLPGIDDMHKMYRDFYKSEPFVRIREKGELPQILEVAGTNFCDIGMTSAQGLVVIVSCIDNLLKGAAGQAVQNMNIMCGFRETLGLL